MKEIWTKLKMTSNDTSSEALVLLLDLDYRKKKEKGKMPKTPKIISNQIHIPTPISKCSAIFCFCLRSDFHIYLFFPSVSSELGSK